MGFIVVHFTRVSSTQEIAKRIMKENTVVVADTMDEGYGRMHRKWFAPFGGLWMSIILKERKNLQLMSLVVGVAVVESFKKFNVDTNLKWPNDVIYQGKKLAGILGEIHEGFAILGIGINLKNEIPMEIENIAISIPWIDRNELLPVLLDEIEKQINKSSRKIIELWKRYDITLGKKVRIKDRNEIYEGVARDIGEDGHIIIETYTGMKDIYTGDLRIIQNEDRSHGI